MKATRCEPGFGLGRTASAASSSPRSTVDTETGTVKVTRILAVHDCGRPINPRLVESQIYGGVIQGLSYALYEERHVDPVPGCN